MNGNKFVLLSTSLLISQEIFLLYEYLRAVCITQSYMKKIFKDSFEKCCLFFVIFLFGLKTKDA